MSSKRLPGKTLRFIKGKTILERVILNLKKTKNIKKIIVSTSNHFSDTKIVNFCKEKKILFTTGSLHNVALRFSETLKKFPCKFFIRISADSPLIDYSLIDKMIRLSKKKNFDIFTNVFPRTFPKGFSVEIIKTNVFFNSYKYFKKNHKEHVSSYFYEKFEKFKIINYTSSKNLSKLNLSVDTKKDFQRISRLIK